MSLIQMTSSSSDPKPLFVPPERAILPTPSRCRRICNVLCPLAVGLILGVAVGIFGNSYFSQSSHSCDSVNTSLDLRNSTLISNSSDLIISSTTALFSSAAAALWSSSTGSALSSTALPLWPSSTGEKSSSSSTTSELSSSSNALIPNATSSIGWPPLIEPMATVRMYKNGTDIGVINIFKNYISKPFYTVDVRVYLDPLPGDDEYARHNLDIYNQDCPPPGIPMSTPLRWVSAADQSPAFVERYYGDMTTYGALYENFGAITFQGRALQSAGNFNTNNAYWLGFLSGGWDISGKCMVLMREVEAINTPMPVNALPLAVGKIIKIS